MGEEAVCASQQQEMPLEDEGLPHLLDKDTDSAILSGEQRQAVLGAMSGRVYCIPGERVLARQRYCAACPDDRFTSGHG